MSGAPRLPEGVLPVTVDLAVFTIRGGVLTVLLVERDGPPYEGVWALPGGFVRLGEGIEAAAWRKLREETGVQRFPGHLEQLRTYGDPGRDPRGHVVSVAHVAMAPGLPDALGGEGARAARWWAVEDLDLGDGVAAPEGARAPLAFDHAAILADALERVRAKLEYTTLALQFVSEPFSLGDLRRVYAAVWGQAPSLGTFRRTVLSTPGFVEQVAQPHPGSGEGAHPPPLLFRRGRATALHPAMLRTARGDHPTRDEDNAE